VNLQKIFDEAIGQAPPTGVDVDRVVGRQRRAARVRPALATLAAVAVLAAGAGVALQLTGEPDVPVPADPLAGFPEYLDGTRVLAGTEGSIGDSHTITFTPTTLDLVLHTRCESDEVGDVPVRLEARLETNIHEFSTTLDWFCTAAETGTAEVDSLGLQDANGWGGFWQDLAVGEPVTVDLTVVGAREVAGGGEPEIPDGTLAVAVAERVPFEEYEFPSRPATLPPVPEAQAGDVELRADPADPNRPVEITFAWDPLLTGCDALVMPLELVSQTPGSLRVLLNGIEVTHQAWWDYQQQGLASSLIPACEQLDSGDEVTIRVEPAHMTGDWQVLLNRSGG
jgi:hypothetical protein